MKGCLTMDKFTMGKFKGIPVYKVSYEQWYNASTQELEEIYVVDGEVYYHDERIGYLDNNKQLEDFDAYLFETLRNKYAKKKANDLHGMVEFHKECAEVEPQREERPVSESVESVAAEDWKTFADNEMAKLKAEIERMEAELNAVG